MTDDAPTSLLILPTVGQLPTDWQEFVTAVPPEWRCRAPWLSGLKPTDERTFELETAVGEVVGHLELNGIARTHLLGLGLGAVVALRVAAQHPGLVDRLVLSGGQVAPPRSVLRAQRTALRLTPRRVLHRRHIDKDRAMAALDTLGGLDLHADLALVRAPALVLVGTGDQQARPAAKLLADGIPDARLRELPGGPLLNKDSPGAFNDAVLGFLGEDLR